MFSKKFYSIFSFYHKFLFYLEFSFKFSILFFHFQYKQVSQANPTVIVPITTGGGQSSQFTESRFSEIKSTPTTFTYVAPVSGGHRSSSYRESHSSQSAPQTVVYTAPAPTGSSRYSHSESFSKDGLTGGYTAPIVTFPTSGGSQFSERTSSSAGSLGGYSAPIITYPVTAGGSSSQFSERSSSSTGSLGGYAAPIVTYPVGGGSSSHVSESSSSTSGSHGGNVGFVSTGFPSSNLHSRFGSEFGSEFGSTSFGSGTSNLDHYISESERLARLQAQNIQGQHGYKGTSTVDIGNAALVQPASGSRTKSWEKSSKWSSQSEVSQSFLTLDKHNINH